MTNPRSETINFPSQKSLLAHYKKHGLATGASSPEEYLWLANQVFKLQTKNKPAKRGAERVYDPSSKRTIIMNPNSNKILTFYVRRALLNN